MLTRTKALGACMVTILLASGAIAADIPGRPLSPAPSPFAAQPASTWEGFYAGVHAGYGKTRDDLVGIRQTIPGGAAVRTLGGNLKPGGALGGLQFGYNWQSGQVVFGVEGDITRLSGKASFTGLYPAPINDTITSSVNKNWTGSIRTRLGYSFGSVLVYSTLGFSGTHVHYRVAPAGGTPLVSSNFRASVVAGAGVEYAINSNWSARVEGLFSPIGLRRIPATQGLNGQVSTYESQGHWLARVGLNYRFDAGGPAAIIARY